MRYDGYVIWTNDSDRIRPLLYVEEVIFAEIAATRLLVRWHETGDGQNCVAEIDFLLPHTGPFQGLYSYPPEPPQAYRTFELEQLQLPNQNGRVTLNGRWRNAQSRGHGRWTFVLIPNPTTGN